MRLILVVNYLKELHEQRVWVDPMVKTPFTLWSNWLKTYKTDSTVPLLQLLWPVTTVRMKNLNVAPSVIIHLRPMWKNPQEFMNRMVILNFTFVYKFDFRFWPTSVFCLLLLHCFFLLYSYPLEIFIPWGLCVIFFPFPSGLFLSFLLSLV